MRKPFCVVSGLLMLAGAVRSSPAADSTRDYSVQASAQELTFLVNGKVLANLVGAVLRDGGVGIFVGGDLNEVVVDRFVVQVPS